MAAWGVGPLENDESLDFLADVIAQGMPVVSRAVWQLVVTCRRRELERDEANIALALGAIAISVRDMAPSSIAENTLLREAASKCKRISRKNLLAIGLLLDSVYRRSEAGDLWAVSGKLGSWKRSVAKLRRIVTACVDE